MFGGKKQVVINKLQELVRLSKGGECINMYVTEATIREYDGQGFLSTTVKKSNIIPIEDIVPLDETLTVQLGDTSKPV